MQKSRNGITLIALIITIIVLLILAGVSLSALVGDNGILNKASDSKEKTEKASEKEQIGLAYSSYIGEKVNNKNVELYIDNAKIVELIDGWEIQFKDTINNYYLNKKDGKIENLQFPILNENEWNGESAVDSEYYGNIVSGLSTELVDEWRLFYKNSSYVYLIINEPINSLNPSNYYENYKNASCISTTGKNLNPMLTNFFNENNESNNMKATTFLTDTSNEIWKKYADNSGVDGAVAIGEPTMN